MIPFTQFLRGYHEGLAADPTELRLMAMVLRSVGADRIFFDHRSKQKNRRPMNSY